MGESGGGQKGTVRGQWGRVRGSSAVCEHFIVCTVDVGMSHMVYVMTNGMSHCAHDQHHTLVMSL